MESQQLTDITRGLQHAAQTTLTLLAEQHIRTLDQFFVPGEDGIFRAKTIRVEIDSKNYVNVPLISLVPPKGLALEKMRVDMSVRLEEASRTLATSRFDSSGVTRTSFKVSAAPRGVEGERRKTDVIDMELEFKAGETPEAIMRIMDIYANIVTPIQPPEGKTPEETEAKKAQWMPGYAKEAWFLRYRKENSDREREKNPPIDNTDEAGDSGS